MLTIPNIKLLIARFTANAMGTPMAKPIPASFTACPKTNFITSRGSAPKAKRTPILRDAPCDAFGEHAVNSDGRQRQSNAAKQRHQHAHDADNRDGIGDLCLEGPDTRQSDPIIDAANHVANARDIAGRVGGYAHEKYHRALRRLEKGLVNRRPARGIPPVLPHVFDRAYDG